MFRSLIGKVCTSFGLYACQVMHGRGPSPYHTRIRRGQIQSMQRRNNVDRIPDRL